MYRLDSRPRSRQTRARLAPAALLWGLVAVATAATLVVRQAHAAGVSPYASAVLADGPAGYWRLGETAGTSPAVDSSGNGRSGTYAQAAGGAVGALVADPDSAATFAGGSSAVSVPNAAVLNGGTGSFAVDAWVKTTAAGGTIVGKSPGFGKPPCGNDQSGGPWGPGWAVTISGSTVKALLADGSLIRGACFTPRVATASGPAGIVANDGKWHHVAVSVDRGAGLVTVSVDGQAVAATLGLTGSVSNSAPLVVGGQIPGSAPALVGTLDEVAVYTHALAPARVQARLAAAAAPIVDHVQDSSQLDTPVLASGSVVDSPSGPATAGTVAVFAWPKRDLVTAATPGTRIALTPVAQGYVTSSGSFALKPDPAVNLATFADADGIANFTVLYRGKSSWGHSAFSATVAAPTGPPGPVADLGDPDASVEPATEDAPDYEPDGPQPSAPEGGEPSDLASAVSGLQIPVQPGAPAIPPTVVFTILEEIYPPRPVRIGETFTMGAGLKARFTYLRTARTTLGIGFRGIFDNGFSISGTSTETAIVGADFSYQSSNTNQAYYASWVFARYSVWIGEQFAARVGDEVRPYELTGGFSRKRATDIPVPAYCDNEPPNFTWTRVRKKLKTFDSGVSIADLIGINLSSQTGASQQAGLYYRFTYAGHMCGNNNYPAEAKRVRGRIP